jgi:CRP/FNR family transcriptional regulator, cyclic AMP receptor protein
MLEPMAIQGTSIRIAPYRQGRLRPPKPALSYHVGDFIFREGDAAGCMYIVLKGLVEISMRNTAYATIPEGRPFGMLSLIDKKPRANTARVMDDCELALLDERTFRVMVGETPGFLW